MYGRRRCDTDRDNEVRIDADRDEVGVYDWYDGGVAVLRIDEGGCSWGVVNGCAIGGCDVGEHDASGAGYYITGVGVNGHSARECGMDGDEVGVDKSRCGRCGW